MAKMTVQPLYLPPQNAEYVRLFNALSLRALPSDLAFGTGSIAFRLLAAVPVFEPAAVCRLSVNGASWTLALSDARWLFAHPLFADPTAAGFDAGDLPDELRTALAEALFSPILAALSAAVGAQVLFEDAAFGGQLTDAAVGFAVTLSGGASEPVRFTAALAPAAAGSAAALASLLAPLPRHQTGMLARSTESVPVSLSFAAGTLVLPSDVFSGLEKGDVLLPDEWLPGSGSLRLLVLACGRPVFEAPCTLKNKSASLAAEPAPLSENVMPDTDALEVKLTFELENRTITVGEMKSLQPGYTFTLTSDPGSPVTILANGKPVAKGRLVDVNGSIGVQLTETL